MPHLSFTLSNISNVKSIGKGAFKDCKAPISINDGVNEMFDSDLQSLNAPFPIDLTFEGILILFNDVQAEKVSSSIIDIELGIVISDKDGHPWKHEGPI